MKHSCLLLSFHYLCPAKGFRWNHPEYDDEGYQDEAEVDETADAVTLFGYMIESLKR
jgi:hypothetical protein